MSDAGVNSEVIMDRRFYTFIMMSFLFGIISGCIDDTITLRPLALGNWWVYEVTDTLNGAQVGSVRDTVRIDTMLIRDGARWFGQKRQPYWFQRNDRGGLYTLVFDAAHPNGYDYLAWRFPAKGGEEWTNNDTVTVSLVSTTERVTTAAGRFSNCCRYVIPYRSDSLRLISEWTIWRKPGVGTVKTYTVSTRGGQTTSRTETLINFYLNQ